MPHMTIGGRSFHYLERGDGRSALFVHGFPFDSTMWIDQLDALADLRRCIAPDLRGFGRSAPVAGEILTMEQHADDLATLVGGLGGQPVDLVGLSMGGYVALAFAERHPALLRSLGLVDTKAPADSEAGKANRDAMAAMVLEEGRSALARDMMRGLLGSSPPQTAKARLRTMIEGTPYETIIGALAGMKARPDRSAVLPSIDVPVAVIVGAEDGVTPPSEAEAMAAAIPHSKLTVIPAAGHLSPVENPVAVAAALRDLFARADAT